MGWDKLSVRDMPVRGKKVLLRVDFNVPLKDGKILDDTRIKATLPTLRYLLEQGASIVLMSHLGDPQGPDHNLSLKPIADHLEHALGRSVLFAPDCIGENTAKAVENLPDGGILLLENLRFHKGEKKPQDNPNFAQKLKTFGDLYVNDAFGTCHRKHASVYEVPKYFPDRAGMGFLVENELKFLGEALNRNLKKPFVVVLGGAKITSKIGVIESLMKKADVILLGGGMGLTFLKAKGFDIGESLFDAEGLSLAERILKQAEQQGVRIVLPVDLRVAESLKGPSKVVPVGEMPKNFRAFDIGTETIDLFEKNLRSAETIFWNGPVGVYETPPFDTGSRRLAEIIADCKALSIVGGGDAAAVVKQAGVAEKITHISTGGGASLEFIEQGTLPGVEVLSTVS